MQKVEPKNQAHSMRNSHYILTFIMMNAHVVQINIRKLSKPLLPDFQEYFGACVYSPDDYDCIKFYYGRINKAHDDYLFHSFIGLRKKLELINIG